MKIQTPDNSTPPPQEILTEQDKKDFMIGEEGICEDYFNQVMSIGMNCQFLLNPPTSSLDDAQKEEVKIEIREAITHCVSYSDFYERALKNTKKPKLASTLVQFLTDEGKENWKRLDEIVAKMKSIGVGNLEQSDLERLKNLHDEVNRITSKKAEN